MMTIWERRIRHIDRGVKPTAVARLGLRGRLLLKALLTAQRWGAKIVWRLLTKLSEDAASRSAVMRARRSLINKLQLEMPLKDPKDIAKPCELCLLLCA